MATRTTAGAPMDFFRKAFPDKPTAEQLENWGNLWFRVGVARSISPRSPKVEFVREIGMVNIEPILFHQPLINFKPAASNGGHLDFIFPERWMTQQEQYIFISALKSHPQIKPKTLVLVEIFTASPLIVGSFIKDDVRIFSDLDQEEKLHGMSYNS